MDKTEATNLGQEFINFTQDSFSWKFIDAPCLKRLTKDLLHPDQAYIDLGCGNGRSIHYLIDQGIPPGHITGVDADPALLQQARQTYPQVTFYQGDITQWHLDQKYYLVSAVFVFHYFDIPQLTQTLNLIHGYTVNDGYLLIQVPHPIRWVHDNLREYFNRSDRFIETPWGKAIPYHHKTLGDYTNTLIKTGFRIVRIDECEVDVTGQCDPEQYAKYTAFPSRLGILTQRT